MDLQLLEVFVSVVEQGSFSGAATALQVQKSTISRQIALLEERCGVPLLMRTTRRISLTPQGRILLAKVQVPLTDLRAIETSQLFESNESAATSLRGRLKLTAPVSLGESLLALPLSRFQQLHPDVEIEVHLTDRVVDLIAEGFDLAIRTAVPEQLSLKLVRLGATRFGVFASPSLIHKKFRSEAVFQAQLQREPKGTLRVLPCLEYWPDDEPLRWDLHGPLQEEDRDAGKSRSLKFAPIRPIRVNSLQLARLLCIEGAGIALLPEFLCKDEVKTGQLRQLLPQWGTSVSRVSAVFPAHRQSSPVVRQFVQILQETIPPAIGGLPSRQLRRS